MIYQWMKFTIMTEITEIMTDNLTETLTAKIEILTDLITTVLMIEDIEAVEIDLTMILITETIEITIIVDAN